MSDLDFIAWSLAAGAIIAALVAGTTRILAAARGKPRNTPRPAERAVGIALCVTLGGLATHRVAIDFLHVQPPLWSGLTIGAVVILTGALNLVSTQPDVTGYSSARTLGYFTMGMGGVVLALMLVDLFRTGVQL